MRYGYYCGIVSCISDPRRNMGQLLLMILLQHEIDLGTCSLIPWALDSRRKRKIRVVYLNWEIQTFHIHSTVLVTDNEFKNLIPRQNPFFYEPISRETQPPNNMAYSNTNIRMRCRAWLRTTGSVHLWQSRFSITPQFESTSLSFGEARLHFGLTSLDWYTLGRL